MNVLWFAFGFYLLGISVVLWYRPSLMFDGDAWKEFGLNRNGNATVFPFWMFILVWTFVSYILGTLCVVGFTKVAYNTVAVEDNIVVSEPDPISVSATAPVSSPIPDSTNTELDLVETPVRRKPRRAKGYYVRGMVKGKPKYVYYGTESPFDMD
jgi:hypothetical protein